MPRSTLVSEVRARRTGCRPPRTHLRRPPSTPPILNQFRQFCWCPNGDGSKNLRLVVPNPAKRPEPLPPKPPELPRIVHVLELARRWQRILDRGEARTRDDLAKLTGLGSRYVGNILELLRLHPTRRARLPAPNPSRRGLSLHWCSASRISRNRFHPPRASRRGSAFNRRGRRS